MATEQVVLLSEEGKFIGTQDKSTVHHQATPYHLAFSCYLRNSDGRWLITRRAQKKVAWPGVWTNSACGHPLPGEETTAAVARRLKFELGVTVDDIRLVHPDFRYRAVDHNGIVENEFCPVYTAMACSALQPNPDEVMEFGWVTTEALMRSIADVPFLFSPWMVAQLATAQLQKGLCAAGKSNAAVR